MANLQYTQSVTSTGAGRDGHIKGDGLIDMDTRPPMKKEPGTNPEALIAAGWAACFNGALQLVMKKNNVDIEAQEPQVTANVGLYSEGEGFQLGGEIVVTFKDKSAIPNADEIVAQAHEFCPVSKLFRGDYVELSARVS